jgi:hypothetical protein
MEKEVIKIKIKSVLDNTNKEVNLPMLCINDYQEIFKELGVEFLPEHMDLNGWQCDFWIVINYNNKKYYLEGSLWYGDYKFYKDNDN